MRTKEYALYDKSGRAILKTYHSSVAPEKRGLKEHHHVENELSLVLSGSGVYRAGSKNYFFHDGDMFLFGSNEAHCITDVYTPLDLLNIRFEMRLLWENPDTAGLTQILLAENRANGNHFPAKDGFLRQCILDIERELAEYDEGINIFIRCRLYEALIHIRRAYDDRCIVPKRDTPSAAMENITKAMRYMDMHMTEKLTLRQTAAAACMAPTYFSAVFKRLNGLSPWEYLTIKRVEKAIALLQTTSLSKLEIAEKCGFGGASNFYKAFNHITGKTPSDFIEK